MPVCLRNKMYRVLLVEWEDAITSSEAGWTPYEEAIKDAETPPPLMVTVGLCLYENDKYIALTDSIGDDECGQVTKIPKIMIKRLNDLRGKTNDAILNEFNI